VDGAKARRTIDERPAADDCAALAAVAASPADDRSVQHLPCVLPSFPKRCVMTDVGANRPPLIRQICSGIE